MAPPPGFTTTRDRDAYASIRGFVYQIDLTILRWLALGPSEHLELECGEDIDIVAKACFDASAEERHRALQQVKHRVSSITLRASASVEAIANAVVHFSSNPDLSLTCCFVSNATSARERPCPFPRGLTGIRVWESLRLGQLAAPDQTARLAELRQLLRSVVKPSTLDAASWQTFVDFIATSSDEGLLDLVRRFEWMLNAPSTDTLSQQVRDSIAARQSTPQPTVQELYDRLFFYVAKLLTVPGSKRLTAEILAAQLAAPTLSADDQRLMIHLRDSLGLLNARVEALESFVTDLRQDFTSLAEQQGLAALTPVVRRTEIIEVPPLIEAGSPRTQTVDELLAQLEQHVWINIYGTSDTGKSQLVAQLASRQGRCRVWLRFHHDMPIPQVTEVLCNALSHATGVLPTRNLAEWFREVCNAFGSGTILVLDDLPLVAGDATCVEPLLLLMRACMDAGVKLLSTSQFRLPVRLRDSGGESIHEIPIPMFTVDEVRDVLVAHGASGEIAASGLIALIQTITHGHPLLLSLAAKYLRDEQWSIGNEQMTALFRGDHSATALDEVVLRIAGSLTATQRELLCRLSLATKPVADAVAGDLAAVAPVVERAREVVAQLVGAWLQRDAVDKLIVSPLASKACPSNLALPTKRQCHVVLANAILSQTITIWDAQVAIMHLLQAEQFDKAGALIIITLQRARSGRREDLQAAAAIWETMTFPVAMSLDIRLKIRAMQLWASLNQAGPSAFLLADLDGLMTEATPTNVIAVVVVAQIAVCFLASYDLTRTLSYLLRAIELVRSAPPQQLPGLRDRELPEMLWLLVLQVNSEESLRQWVRCVDSLTTAEQEAVRMSRDAILGSSVLADRLMVEEYKKTADQRQWEPVLASLNWLYEEALRQQWVWLAACALKTIVDICGNALRTTALVVTRVQSFVAEYSQHQQATALVAGTLGRVLTVLNQYDDARSWLERAIAVRLERLNWDQTLVLLAAARAFSETDRARALEYADAAVDVVLESNDVPDLEAAKTCAEGAVAEYCNNPGVAGAIAAFPKWIAAATRVLQITDRDDEWKDFFVLFAHVNSYLTALVTRGSPPTETAEGQPYGPPLQGMFLTSNPNRLALFRENRIAPVLWLLSQYAWACGDQERSTEWLDLAIDELASRPATGFDGLVWREQIPTLLLRNRFDEAINAGLRAGQALVISQAHLLPNGTSLEILEQPLDDVLPRLAPADSERAARLAITLALLPTFYRIAREMLMDADLGREYARQVSQLCLTAAMGLNADRRWTIAARLFAFLADSGVNPRLVLAEVNPLDSEQDVELRVLGYLIAAHCGPPDLAIKAQLAVLHIAVTWSPEADRQYELLFIPYIQDFWKSKLEIARFAFSSPQLVESSLREAICSPAAGKLRRILRAVEQGLPIHNMPDARVWLMADA